MSGRSGNRADDPWSGLPPEWRVGGRFDGGDTGCGEMILDLRMFVRTLAPGTRVAIRTADAGAPIEIPAWCRLAGHTLLDARPPFYLAEVGQRKTS